MTLEELRKKIYLNLRKYIFSPLSEIEKQKEKDILSQEIQKYLHNMNIKDDSIINMIEEEYVKVFNEANGDENIKRNINSFINDIPFRIYLQEKNSKNEIIIIDKNNFFNISKELKELLDINSFEDTLEEKFSLLENYEIYVDFNINSKYINNKEMKLNSCLCYKTDFKNIKIKRNKSQKKTNSKN